MIKKTLEMTGPVNVRITTVGDDGEHMPADAPVCMYVSDVDKPGLWFTLEEVKAMQAFLSEVMYEAERKRHDPDSVVAW